MNCLDRLEKKLGYRFQNPLLLENALTHSSYANENRDCKTKNNERLEFLGDSVLGMIVAEYLFHANESKPEGELTRLRATLVCEESLVEVAHYLEIGAFLRLGRGEESNGGRSRPSILADAVEATLAAVYLDGGLDAVRKVIETCLLRQRGRPLGQDYKTALQELVQRESGHVLSYHLTGETGPDHAKVFSVEVQLNGRTLGTGTGHSKKEAEQTAAREAISCLTAQG